MRCPQCGSDQLTVLDSRPRTDSVRRRRECLNCGHRFSTMEKVVCDPVPQPGEIAYLLCDGTIIEEKVYHVEIHENAVYIFCSVGYEVLGETIFATQEAAAAALRKEKCKNAT